MLNKVKSRITSVKKIISIVILLIFCSELIFAKVEPEKKWKIVKQYRNLELLKFLDLNEKESQKVLPLIKEIDKNRETFHFEKKRITEELEIALDNQEKRKINKLINELIELEKEFNLDNYKLLKRIRDILPEEKFARYLIFEQKFVRKLQEKIHSHEKKPGLRW